MEEDSVLGLNRVLRAQAPRKRLLRSRSDKLLTTMRRLENQRAFVKPGDKQEFFELPFNKGAAPEAGTERAPLKSISQNSANWRNPNFSLKGEIEKRNKENAGQENKSRPTGKAAQKRQAKAKGRAQPKAAKIFMNDVFDAGIVSEIQARESFMLDTVLRSAVMKR